MSKKPSLTISKESRLKDAMRELNSEIKKDKPVVNMKQTTVILEADLLYAAKEVALKRKRAGVQPNTITGMIRESLKNIVDMEANK